MSDQVPSGMFDCFEEWKALYHTKFAKAASVQDPDPDVRAINLLVRAIFEKFNRE